MFIVKNLIISFFAVIILSCASIDKSEDVNNENKVLFSLAKLEGKYVWNTETKKFIYSKKLEIERILSASDRNKVIHVLAKCIGDVSLSSSVLNGNKVKLGVVCYEALSQTIYHEPLQENGDIALNWAGHVLPNASASELEAAKNAWIEAIVLKKYNFL